MTHCLMIIHHYTKLGNKKKWLSGSGDTDTMKHTEKLSLGHTFTDILNLHCDLDLECSDPIFFAQDTMAYDVVLSNQVWLQTAQQFRR